MLSSGEKFTGKDVVNPFSDKFVESWDIWKMYKHQDHRFTYKSPISEQAGLNELVDLSDGNEQEAVRIITRSMAHGWKGLFRIHKPKNQKKDGTATSTEEGGTSKPAGKEAGLNDLKVAHLKRYGNGG